MLAAAVAHALWNALLKRPGADPVVGSVGLCLCWALVGWPAWALLPPMAPAAWTPLLLSVVIHLVYFSLLIAAYRVTALSLVYPIARGTPPVLVALASAWALDESLSSWTWVSVALLAAGVLILAQRGSERPVALGFALGTAVCTALYTLVDGYGVRQAQDAVGYTVRLVALQGALFACGGLLVWGRPLGIAVWASRWAALGAGLLSLLGYGVALWAMLQAPVAAVAALRETSVPVAALLGALWLGEPIGLRRGFAIALVLAGALCVRLSG